MSEKEKDFRGVSLKRELVEQIETFIIEFPQYKSIADFVHEAVRLRMEQIRGSQKPRFEQFNYDENGVKIIDRELHDLVQVFIKPDGITCSYHKAHDCAHIDFALSIPEVRKILEKKRKEGWKLPEVN